MESRGQKRADEAEELPADKRACSSHEFRASSSNSTWLNSENPVRDDNVPNADMDTSSSASASGSRSEEEAERDSGYGSCDSDDMDQRHSSLRAFQRRRSSDDQSRLKSALASLSEGTDPSVQLVSLTELCEVLSFCTEGSLSSVMVESLAPVLVRLASHENNPEIMLLSIRALTYMCDVFPRASGSLVRHEAVPALCDRLLAIEYLDVAEQCLQALEKISHEQPHACLQAGAIMAVLGFIDFFSTSIQRVALSTVVNICKKLPADDCSSHFMVAVPTLCNLLQYEDRQLVESVAICLIKIAERVGQSSELLDELCKHGLVSQAVRLIHLSSLTTLSLPIYNGLIGLLCILSSGSILALRTLHDLNICCILKNILAASDLSRGMSSTNVIDVQSNQVHEVLKLLNELLPNPVRDQEVGPQLQLSDKELFFADHPDLLPKIGLDVLPMLIQVVNAGANMYVCYGCLSIMYKLIHFSNSDMLLELINANIPSFLAGVLIRKDHHVLILAMHIAETILQKYPDFFMNTFIKEGVFSAIYVLMTPQKCSLSMFPKSNAIPLPSDSSQKLVSKVSLRCLCYAFDTGQIHPSSETGICMLEKDCVQNLATHIRSSYFSQELKDSRKGFTDIFQDLKALSAKLSDAMHSTAVKIGSLTLDSEQLSCILPEIIKKLDGKEHVSTFEFIGSGTAKSLINFISNGRYLVGNGSFRDRGEDDWIVEKRFENFGKLILSSLDFAELPLVNLVRKLQSALSSLENFPVVLSSQVVSQRNSFAAVPRGRYISHACMRVRFQRLEGEIDLGEYSHDILTVDPFSSLDEIEQFLFPKVRINGTEKVEVPAQPLVPTDTKRFKTRTDVNTDQAKITDRLESVSMATDLPEMQENEVYVSHSSLGGVENSRVSQPPVATSENESHTAAPLQVVQLSSEQDTDMSNLSPAPHCNIDPAPKMLFYLEDKQLDRRATLYQAILQQKLITEPETDTSLTFWSQIYVLRYGTATKCNDAEPGEQLGVSSPLSYKVGMHHSSFFSGMFDSKLSSILDPSSSAYDIVWLLKSLERLNRFSFHLMSRERMLAFAEGVIDNLDGLKVVVPSVSQNEFMNCKLTEKLEQQMRDQLAVSIGGMPLWCSELMESCPFLFSFEAKSKYFRLSAFVPSQVQRHPSTHIDQGGSRDRRPSPGGSPRKKFSVCRERILESAAKMMDLYASAKLPIEVVYNDEVGTGLGPTLEFFTLVSHEFQKSGIGMWRGDHDPFTTNKLITSPFGLFPRPWPSASETSRGIQFADVMKKFVLLGQVVAKALQDGRFLDLPFSKAFYKLILQQELNLHDIQSFDPELGRTLAEFQALLYRKKHLESAFANRSFCPPEACFRDSRIEELCLNFSLPGYPEHLLGLHDENKMVNMENLNEYVALTVDATLCSGIYQQVEAFKRGFNQVFPINYLSIFTEEELERLLCGERDFSDFNELVDHIKFDHGYTVSSRPIIHLIEILREFNYEQRRAFLQFVTGAPRLPPGGLAALNPKLTIVRKHCSSCADEDLPSVMTCANYLKLPSYSSKEKMKEKLIYAITEGQGSFHLS